MSSDIYHIKCQAGVFAELTNRVFLEAVEGNISSACHTVTFPMETMRMVRMLRKVMMMTLTERMVRMVRKVMMVMMMTKSGKFAGD